MNKMPILGTVSASKEDEEAARHSLLSGWLSVILLALYEDQLMAIISLSASHSGISARAFEAVSGQYYHRGGEISVISTSPLG